MMTKLADELGAMAKAIRTAIEYMPYLDRQKEDDDGDYLPLTLREFYEETWQGSYADELFQDVENVIITALRQPVADEAQRLQDHMEQHHGVCLQASQWDAAITALRQPDAAPGDLVERLLGHCADKDGCLEAAAAIQSLTAERDALRDALGRIADPNGHDNFAGDPMEWSSTIARVALGLHPHPKGSKP